MIFELTVSIDPSKLIFPKINEDPNKAILASFKFNPNKFGISTSLAPNPSPRIRSILEPFGI